MPRPFLSVARARIAADGIRGLSLRSVASEAGASLGALNYHIGDKAALVARLIEEERADNGTAHAAWLARAGRLDLAAAGTLALVITAYIDDAADARREASLTGCELLLEAGVDPQGYAAIAGLLDDEDQFWAALLDRAHGTDAPLFGRVIAAYCRDELPFTIAAGRNPDYRLLRAATVGRLAERMTGTGGGISLHFEMLVAACGIDQAAVPLPVDLPVGSKKADLARHIAALIAEQGVGSITHRLVAARAGVSNSNVAHHFRTRGDLLDAGMGMLILDMRRDLRANARDDGARSRSPALIRATHAIALAAARDPGMVPFALDMRRRRAENVRDMIRERIVGKDALDGAAIQAAVMVMIGSYFASQARGNDEGYAIGPDQLAMLRRGAAAS